MFVNTTRPSSGPLGFRPLYRQVKEVLLDRIARGVWRPGDVLPSENALAIDLATSPGTVRKALDELTAEHVVVRRQGRGTFVAKHDDARILFRFFRLAPDDGAASFPESRVLSVVVGPAGQSEAMALSLAPGREVVRLTRERSLAARVVILERIVLPADPFGPLAAEPVPNNLYELYASRFGVTIARASERLKAVAATGEDSASLGVAPATPLLLIDRIAADLDARPVEWRVSRCLTDLLHYGSDLR